MNDNDNIMNTNGAAEPAQPAQSAQSDWVLLHRYLENRVDPKERLNVEEILRTNASARRTLDALREEQRLLREALEVRAEPSHRLSDKVLFQLYAEERTRQQTVRTRRWRRQASIGLGVAAAVALCVFLIRPRDAAGTFNSGSGAEVLMLNGEVRKLTHDMHIFEGDCVFTTQGQFVRLKLFNKSLLDLDENSRLVVEKAGLSPSLRVQSGRLGLNSVTSRNAAVIYLPQGSVSIPAGSWVDVWLPQRAEAIAPALLPGITGGSGAELSDVAVVTVLKGAVNVANEQSPNGVTLSEGQRVVFAAGTDLAAGSNALSQASINELLQVRGDAFCWNKQETSPQDRGALGLLDDQDYSDLGKRLKMDVKLKDVPEALERLQAAHAAKAPADRAAKLAAGQAELRRAYDELGLDDVRRPYTRMIEGLAHAERGRLLVDLSNGQLDKSADASASSAFEAASVAFEEALRPNAEDPNANSRWLDALKAAGPGRKLTDLTSAEQSAIMASFHHAVALYWQARTGDKSRAAQAAAEFDTLFQALGHHIESLEAKYGEGLAYSLAGDHAKAIETYKMVLAVPLAGCAENTRRIGDGIRQSALAALAHEYLVVVDYEHANETVQRFQTLYPLEPANPTLLEMQSEIKLSNISR